MLLTPSPCHKLSHFLGPPHPSSVTYFMDGPIRMSTPTYVQPLLSPALRCNTNAPSIVGFHAFHVTSDLRNGTNHQCLSNALSCLLP